MRKSRLQIKNGLKTLILNFKKYLQNYRIEYLIILNLVMVLIAFSMRFITLIDSQDSVLGLSIINNVFNSSLGWVLLMVIIIGYSMTLSICSIDNKFSQRAQKCFKYTVFISLLMFISFVIWGITYQNQYIVIFDFGFYWFLLQLIVGLIVVLFYNDYQGSKIRPEANPLQYPDLTIPSLILLSIMMLFSENGFKIVGNDSLHRGYELVFGTSRVQLLDFNFIGFIMLCFLVLGYLLIFIKRIRMRFSLIGLLLAIASVLMILISTKDIVLKLPMVLAIVFVIMATILAVITYISKPYLKNPKYDNRIYIQKM